MTRSLSISHLATARRQPMPTRQLERLAVQERNALPCNNVSTFLAADWGFHPASGHHRRHIATSTFATNAIDVCESV